MKNLLCTLIALIGLLACEKNPPTVEKTEWLPSEIKNCECENKTAICVFDTLTPLFSLKNVNGELFSYEDSELTYQITFEDYKTYLIGKPYEFGQPYYWWYIAGVRLAACNMPNEIRATKKYNKRKVIFSADVIATPPPPPGVSYPSGDGNGIILKDIKILPE